MCGGVTETLYPPTEISTLAQYPLCSPMVFTAAESDSDQSFEESFLVKPKKNKVKKIFSDSEDESDKENSKISENSKIHEKDDSELDDSEPEPANVESSDESE